MEFTQVKLVYERGASYDASYKISSSETARKYLVPLFEDVMDFKERFAILCVNRANKVCGYYVCSEGGTSGTVVDVKNIFQTALLMNASGLILAHNHPSGNLEPSSADKRITQKVQEAGRILDIEVLDHIILTSEGFTSFADGGYL